MHTELLILGAGGHAKVVIEAIRGFNKLCKIQLVDEDPKKNQLDFFDNLTIECLDNWKSYPNFCHVAIGDNKSRFELSKTAEQNNKIVTSVIHRNALLSSSAIIDEGVFIAAGSIVSAESCIGRGTIINHNTVIDHDCIVGHYSHIAPNSTLCGGVKIGAGCLIGAGSTILPNVEVGDNVTVGAGSVVKQNLKDNQTFIN